VHDELRERGIEHPVGKRQVLRRADVGVDAGVPIAECGHELLGGIDRGDRRGAEPLDELAGQGTWPRADVDHALACFDAGEVGHLCSEL
jgi:hypothetical protein